MYIRRFEVRRKKKGLFSKSGLILIVCVTLISAVAVISVHGSIKKSTAELTADELRWRNNAQALLTAESGLLVGTGAFKKSGMSAGTTKMTLDGSAVTIELTESGAKDGYVRIISTVRHAGLDYDKRVEWQVRAEKRSLPDGSVGYFPSSVGGDTGAAGLVRTAWREADVPRS